MTPEEQRQWAVDQFDRCAPFIQRAIDRTDGLFELHHVRDDVLSGAAQLWPAPNAALVTRIEVYPTGIKACNEWLAGGDLDELLKIEPEVAAWAKDKIGCDRIYLAGRKGWIRILKDYTASHTVLRKDLNK
jgi:hypothetical protein